jgi:hypothetical protein
MPTTAYWLLLYKWVLARPLSCRTGNHITHSIIQQLDHCSI